MPYHTWPEAVTRRRLPIVVGDDPQHDNLAASALEFVAGREDVRSVDRTTVPDPDPIDGHVPDVTARSYGVLIVAEAVTGEQLDDPATVERLKAFWPAADEDGERSTFHVFVPRGETDRLRDV